MRTWALKDCARCRITPPGELQKAIGEGLGLAKAFCTETWMRLVHPRERALDVRVKYFDKTDRGDHTA